MTEQSSDDIYIVAPDHLLLFDEVVSCGIPPRRLIDAAVKEEIELLFEVPAQRVSPVLVPHQGMNSFGEPDALRTPEYLVLEPRYCQLLQHKSSVLVQEAVRGYRRRRESKPLHALAASDADNEPDRPVSLNGVKSVPPPGARSGRWRCWALQLNGAPFDYQVNRESLRVLASDVYRRLGWRMKRFPSYSFVPTENAQHRNVEFVSTQLMRMSEAADVFWGGPNVDPDDRDTYPPREKIIEWFMSSAAGFTENSATAAASLITPDWVEPRGRPSK